MKKMVGALFFVLLVTVLTFSVKIQAEEMSASKGIGPVKKTELKAIDNALAETGKKIFTTKCAACHKIEKKYVGPALYGVTKRRQPEWIQNMILNPQEMTQKDPVAMELFSTFLVQMTFQNVTEADVRAILEFFRLTDSGPMPTGTAGAPAAPAPKAPAKAAAPAVKK